MSYEIVYQYKVFPVSARAFGDGVQRFVVAVEMGSNNCYDHNNKRTREWSVLAVGTQDEVLRQTVRIASSCEGGMLKPGGRDCTPEAFIGKIRRLLKSAGEGGGVGQGSWRATARLMTPEMEALATQLGAEVREEQFCGEKRKVGVFGDEMAAYFKFVTVNHMEMYGWSLGRVSGLPRS